MKKFEKENENCKKVMRNVNRHNLEVRTQLAIVKCKQAKLEEELEELKKEADSLVDLIIFIPSVLCPSTVNSVID